MKICRARACLLACAVTLLTVQTDSSATVLPLATFKIGVPVQTNLTDIVTKLENGIVKLPVPSKYNDEKSADVLLKIKQANSSMAVSKPNLSINGQSIAIPILTATNVDKKGVAVSQTLGSFADTLKSVTDQEECDCDPKDSAKSVQEIIEATSTLSQDLLRCLLDTLKSSIKTKEATLIRTMVKESMGALKQSVKGIYALWKADDSQDDLKSVQTIVDGLMSVLTSFSSRMTTALASSPTQRIETVSYVVNQLVNLVANTSIAIADDVANKELTDNQVNDIFALAKSLSEPLTSSVLAEFVSGTARIPYINKLVVQYTVECNMTRYCATTNKPRADLARALLRSLGKAMKSMSIRVGAKDPNVVASEAHRVSTTNFLLNLIQELETMVRTSGKITTTVSSSSACHKRGIESLSNIVEIVKKVINNIQTEVKDATARQQSSLSGNLAKDLADMVNVIGATLVESKNPLISNTTSLIYQQFEILKRVAKNDQAISRDTSVGTKSTITLLVDIGRLELKYVQSIVEKVKKSDSSLRLKCIRDINMKMIRSLVSVGRGIAPADNKPLIDITKGSGHALALTIGALSKTFEKRPKNFGDVLYEVFCALTDVDRKLLAGAATPSKSGLPTTVPTDIIFGTVNCIRTSVDWANALTRTSGMDDALQIGLIKFVVDIVEGAQESLKTSGNEQQASFRSELSIIKDRLTKILFDLKNGVKPITVAPKDDEDYSDESDSETSSGITQIVSVLHDLDELLKYIIESGNKQQTSIVLRNTETTVSVLMILFEDVCRTPSVQEDGCIVLPSGTLKPNSGTCVSTTPMPQMPETKPPATTTTSKPVTVVTSMPNLTTRPSTKVPVTGRDSDTDCSSTARPGQPGSPSTARPGFPPTVRPSTVRPGHPSSIPTTRPGSPSTTHPEFPPTTRPGHPSTTRPGQPGSPSTTRPGSPSTTRPGQPGSPSTTRPGQPGSPSTTRPGSPSTTRPGHPSTTRPGQPGSPSTTRPGQPGSPSTTRPGSPSTTRPGQPGSPSTTRPGSPSTTRPGQPGSPSTTRPGSPSTTRPGHPSTTRPGQPGSPSTTRPGQPGSPSTTRPGSPSTTRPGHPSTTRPGHPSTTRPGQPGSPSTTRPGSPSTTRPGHPSTTRPGQPGSPSTTRPGQPGSPSTTRPGSPSTTRPGQPGSPSTTRPGQPGSPSTTRPGSPSTTRPGQPGSPSTTRPGQPGSPSTTRPGSPSTTRPGSPSTVRPGQPGSPSTIRPDHPHHQGRCSLPNGSLDKVIAQLEKHTDLKSDDLTKLEKVIEDLMKKMTSKHCSLKDVKVPDANSKQVLAEVIETLIKQKSCLCN